jgi:threonine aldolase
MIDLRSDTVTKPTDAMRQAMAGADVGDDVYGGDPTVRVLEDRVAELLGKEAAVFVPSGTMSNQVAMRTHTEPGSLVLMDSGSHMVLNEGGGAAAFSGQTVRPVPSHRGIFDGEAVEGVLEVPHRFNPSHLMPPAAMLCVENTHNVGGGTVWPLSAIHDVAEAGRRHGMALHMDGARLWHASAAAGVAEAEYAAPFDTVSVCFSKGLGAPMGSALAGTSGLVARARRFKQQFGGGLRQAGIVAAGALHALEHHRPRLGEDHENARILADGLAALDGIELDPTLVETNIVRFHVSAMEAGPFVDACHDRGVFMLPGGTHGVRAVTHMDVGRQDIDQALAVVRSVLEEA